MPTLQIPDRPDRFGVAVPDSWAVFDVLHLQLVEARRMAMSHAKSKEERLATDRLFDQARRTTKAARRSGAIWGAGTATAFDDGLFVAQVMVFAVAGRPGEDFGAPMVRAALGGDRDGDGRDLAPRAVGVVDLTDGVRATRVTGLEDVAVDRNRTVRMVASQTFVPVPGTTDEYLLLMGVSPNVDYQVEVLDLFDAIASTFTYYALSDPPAEA